MVKSRSLNEVWGVVGHDWAVESLDNAIRNGRAAHAFLLTGTHGIGKTTLARALTRRLQCTGDNPPCGICRACEKNARNTSPDLIVLEGVPPLWKFDRDGYLPPPRKSDRERRTLRIDQINKYLIPWLATSPFESRYKIAILRRFEEANEEAANAFLKTLEEPPSHVFLILTSQDVSLLLPTIASRTQKLALSPLATKAVERALREKWNTSADDARLLSRLSSGRLGWAVRASNDLKIREARNMGLDILTAFLEEGRAERLTRAHNLGEKTEDLPQLLELWSTWWRDVMLIQNGDATRLTNVDREQVLEIQAGRFSAAQVQFALKSTRVALRQLDQNANARLVMEVLGLNLPHA